MGIQERKERERANMRRLILETANSLFISKGFDNISIRNIAKLIEYSPATIYLYFKNKEEIIFSLRNTFIEDLLELSVGCLFCGLQCEPGVPDCLEALIGKLFNEVVRTFLIPIMLNTPLALFPIFVKRLS